MQIFSETEIQSAIDNRAAFEAELPDGSVHIRVHDYVPYVCTAIHAGHHLRDTLLANCLLSDAARKQEEDPYTDQLIDSFPIILTARDSRYEYDLNRPQRDCLYDEAWGEPVWKALLTPNMRKISHSKHDTYYRLLHMLITSLEKQFGSAILIDVHSYNWQIRQYDRAPVFNIGTAQVNTNRWSTVLEVLERELRTIKLPGLTVDVARNMVFQGRGYQASFIKDNFLNTLIIPLEVKKVFMDEYTGKPNCLVMDKLRQGLYHAVLEAADVFKRMQP